VLSSGACTWSQAAEQLRARALCCLTSLLNQVWDWIYCCLPSRVSVWLTWMSTCSSPLEDLAGFDCSKLLSYASNSHALDSLVSHCLSIQWSNFRVLLITPGSASIGLWTSTLRPSELVQSPWFHPGSCSVCSQSAACKPVSLLVLSGVHLAISANFCFPPWWQLVALPSLAPSHHTRYLSDVPTSLSISFTSRSSNEDLSLPSRSLQYS